MMKIKQLILSTLLILPITSYAKIVEASNEETVSYKVKSLYQHGIASYYAGSFHGRKTASGSIYNMNSLSCAHRSLPFGTTIRVTNLKNGKHVNLKVLDRGPFVKGRILDMSFIAAKKLDCIDNGLCKIGINIIK